MKNENEWVSLNDDGTIWAYCGPGTDNVLGLVFKHPPSPYQWHYETKDGRFRMIHLHSAAQMVQDFH